MEELIPENFRENVLSLRSELDNFQEIARYFKPNPGELPDLEGIDVYGESLQLKGLIGGDHIIYVDFKTRYDLDARIELAEKVGDRRVIGNLIDNKSKAGIVLSDVSGHRITDALLSAMLHQAFLMGAIYELDHHGEITPLLFENLNTRFYKSSSVSKFITMIYGEISTDGKFQFISAGHPMPIVFSRRFDQIMDISDETMISFPPVGTLPSQDDIDRRGAKSVLGYKQSYKTNEMRLMAPGDILLLYTDGLSEHTDGKSDYFPGRLEEVLRKEKDRSAKEIFGAIREDVLSFSPQRDDISFVVIKRM
jgi:serine phosphatase RsbU (regulator of sigma subunit)